MLTKLNLLLTLSMFFSINAPTSSQTTQTPKLLLSHDAFKMLRNLLEIENRDESVQKVREYLNSALKGELKVVSSVKNPTDKKMAPTEKAASINVPRIVDHVLSLYVKNELTGKIALNALKHIFINSDDSFYCALSAMLITYLINEQKPLMIKSAVLKDESPLKNIHPITSLRDASVEFGQLIASCATSTPGYRAQVAERINEILMQFRTETGSPMFLRVNGKIDRASPIPLEKYLDSKKDIILQNFINNEFSRNYDVKSGLNLVIKEGQNLPYARCIGLLIIELTTLRKDIDHTPLPEKI